MNHTTLIYDKDEICAWALRHCIDTITVGYTMRSEDTADEWVQLSDGGTKLRTSHGLFTLLFAVGPGFPRSIARLKDPIAAERRKAERAAQQRQTELAMLARLKRKYEP